MKTIIKEHTYYAAMQDGKILHDTITYDCGTGIHYSSLGECWTKVYKIFGLTWRGRLLMKLFSRTPIKHTLVEAQGIRIVKMKACFYEIEKAND